MFAMAPKELQVQQSGDHTAYVNVSPIVRWYPLKPLGGKYHCNSDMFCSQIFFIQPSKATKQSSRTTIHEPREVKVSGELSTGPPPPTQQGRSSTTVIIIFLSSRIRHRSWRNAHLLGKFSLFSSLSLIEFHFWRRNVWGNTYKE